MTMPRVFDRHRIAERLAQRPDEGRDFITSLVLEDLAERLLATRHAFARAIIIGPDPRPFPRTGISGGGPIAFAHASTLLEVPGVPLVPTDPLALPEDGYDLIVSLFDLQIIDDVPGFLARIRAQLAPDGLFLGAAVGGDSLRELRAAFLAAEAETSGGASARIAPMIPFEAVPGLLQRAGLALPVADLESHTVRYGDPLALMRELKGLGAANPLADRPSRPMTRQLLATALQRYGEIAADPDGRVRASLDIIWLSGWAPHESQPKPLRPGSATVSLATILGKKQ
jgi:SAM-dependent methyltransferase